MWVSIHKKFGKFFIVRNHIIEKMAKRTGPPKKRRKSLEPNLELRPLIGTREFGRKMKPIQDALIRQGIDKNAAYYRARAQVRRNFRLRGDPGSW